MSDEKKKPEDKNKDDKAPEIKDLEPEKNPSLASQGRSRRPGTEFLGGRFRPAGR